MHNNRKIWHVTSLGFATSAITFLPFIIFLCGIVYFATNNYSLFSFPLDDAWIHRVYSLSFSQGNGFQYNEGVQEAGSTSPLWSIITSPAHWMEPLGTNSVVIAVKILGVLLGIFSVSMVYVISKQISGSIVTGVIASSLFAIEPRLLFSSLSGMETLLLVSIWLACTAAFLLDKKILAVIIFSLAPVVRPEALIILPVFILVLFLNSRKTSDFIREFYLWVLLLVPMSLWMTFCKMVTGHWFPNTFYLKSQPFHMGWQELKFTWSFISEYGYGALYIFIIGVVAFVIFFARRRSEKKYTIFLLTMIAPVLYILGVVSSRKVNVGGYYWSRWSDPASLILTASFCIGLATIIVFLVRNYRKNNAVILNQYFAIPVSLLIIISSLVLLYSGILLSSSLENRRSQLISDSRAIELINVRAGKWIEKNTTPEAVIGVNDAGAIRYFGKRKTIDLVGLNNADMAFGKMSFSEALYKADWLAIFPGWFQAQREEILASFQPVKAFKIPAQEYTICDCPGQSAKYILKKYH